LGKKQTLKQGYLVVTVDGLRVRLEPNLYSDIIKNLKKGDKVFFTGKRGKKSYKVILNSKYHITPFLQVDCLDGKTGWIYAGGLLDMNRVKLKVDVNKNFTKEGLFTFTLHNLSPHKFTFPSAKVIVNIWNNKGFNKKNFLYRIGFFDLNANPDKKFENCTDRGTCEFLDDNYVKQKGDGSYILSKKRFLPKIPRGSYSLRIIVEIENVKSYYSNKLEVNVPLNVKS
jgi:hypothetical protein